MYRTKCSTSRWLRLLAVVIACATPSLAPAQEAPVSAVTPLEELVAEAVEAYPDLLSRWAEVDALRAREDQVNQPFDPMINLSVLNVPVSSFQFDEHAMTGIAAGIRQRFYWPGVLDAREEAARAVAASGEAAIPERVIRLWMDAVEPYYAIAGLDRAEAVLNDQLVLFDDLREAARGRYEARVVPLTDVLRVETEISRVREILIEVQRNRRTAVAQLNGLLNRAETAPLIAPTARDPVPLARTSEEWLELAVERRPAFDALRARTAAIDARIAAAEANADPVWEVGLGYTARFQDTPVGNDLLSLTLGINLPFFSSNRADAAVNELSALGLEVGFDRDELLRGLRAQIDTQVEGGLGIEEEIRVLDEELIPSIESVYEGALSHYASSHTNIEVLIEIQVRLLELELMRTHLVSQHDMRRGHLSVIAASSEEILTIARREQ